MSRIEQLINEIEEYIDSCKYQPLSNTKILVNKEEMEELIVELRLRVPEEIKKYQKIINQQDAILADARSQAESMIADATAQTNELVSDHEVMQRAYAKANELMEEARAQAWEKFITSVTSGMIRRLLCLAALSEMAFHRFRLASSFFLSSFTTARRVATGTIR